MLTTRHVLNDKLSWTGRVLYTSDDVAIAVRLRSRHAPCLMNEKTATLRTMGVAVLQRYSCSWLASLSSHQTLALARAATTAFALSAQRIMTTL